MSVDRTSLIGVVDAFHTTITGLSPKEREKPVTLRYATEFNRFLEMAKKVAPEHDERLWPQPIPLPTDPMILIVPASYVEIDTASRQVVMLLRGDGRPLPIMRG